MWSFVLPVVIAHFSDSEAFLNFLREVHNIFQVKVWSSLETGGGFRQFQTYLKDRFVFWIHVFFFGFQTSKGRPEFFFKEDNNFFSQSCVGLEIKKNTLQEIEKNLY